MIMYTYKVMIHPNNKQETKMRRTLNKCIECNNIIYDYLNSFVKNNNTFPKCSDVRKWFTSQKTLLDSETISKRKNMTKKEMIESQKEKGWEFIYLAANIDALSSAKEYGISEECCTDYINDQKGNEIKYACMSEAISTIRKEKRLGRKWSQRAKEDYKKRK